MAIFVDEQSRVIIQGITGHVGRAFAERLAQYHSTFMGGVTPGKGGSEVAGRPVYNTVTKAVEATGANTSIVTVPATFAPDAMFEAIDAGIKVLSVYTEHVPVHEALKVIHYAKARGTHLFGPNCAGIVSPGKASASEIHDRILSPGSIGIVSKSGTLAYEAIDKLDQLGYGQSTVACLGGDKFIGTRYIEILQAFEEDDQTAAIVLLGEIGGSDEIDAIPTIENMTKPVFCYVAGSSAPPGKRMGHAGAIIQGDSETAEAKTLKLRKAGAVTMTSVLETGELVNRFLSRTP
ncbi:succinate--CoA ligase subunit alpha [Chloroflexota bacterium]